MCRVAKIYSEISLYSPLTRNSKSCSAARRSATERYTTGKSDATCIVLPEIQERLAVVRKTFSMGDITLSIIKDGREIDILRSMTSKYKDFMIKFNEETLNLLKKNLKLQDSLYIMAKQGDNFVAFCSVDPEWWENNYFFIREIFVQPNFQRQKIGEMLMGKCIGHARQKGAIGIVTETAFENIPMQKLCAKLGFKKWDNPRWKAGITYKLLF